MQKGTTGEPTGFEVRTYLWERLFYVFTRERAYRASPQKSYAPYCWVYRVRLAGLAKLTMAGMYAVTFLIIANLKPATMNPSQ